MSAINREQPLGDKQTQRRGEKLLLDSELEQSAKNL
jgi:hypothetical protein